MTTYEDQFKAVQEMIAEGRHDEAISALETLVATHEGHAAAHFDLGNLYYAAGDMEKALMNYENSARLSPDDPLYLKNFADLLYREKKDADGALEMYDKIIALRPEDVPSLMMTGHLCVSLEHFDRALGYYNRVLDLEPWNAEAQQFVDRVQQRIGVPDERNNTEAVHAYCQQLAEQGRIPEAIEELEKLLIGEPEFALAYNDLGVLYYRQGDKQKCVMSYEKAVSIEPDNPNFQKNLADFYLVEQGEVKKALEIYLSVLNNNPEDIDILMVSGHICSSLGRIDSARLFYSRILDVEPWNIEASERLQSLRGEPVETDH